MNSNLEDWEVTRVTSTEIEIKILYKDQREVSTDHDKDKLYCEVNLTMYANKQRYIAPYTILETEIPIQNPSPGQQRFLDNIKEFVKA